MTTDWNFDAVWNKAKLYVDRAAEAERDGPLFPFWSILGLELLGRAVLAAVHPALLADPREGANVMFAFGYGSPERPKSIPAASVFRRCALVVEEFTEAEVKGTTRLIELRNEELHSGGTPLEALPTGVWLADYYRVSQLLLQSFGKVLADLFGDDEAAAAQTMITAAAEELESEVKQLIANTRKDFEALGDAVRETAKQQAETQVAERFALSAGSPANVGKLEPCPACETTALITGEVIRQSEPRVGDEAILIDVIKLPTRLRCLACGLDLEGHGRLHAVGLGGQYTHELAEDP
jgi:hypothetical protein